MARKGIKARATSRKAVKAQSDYSLFKALAPRMMRDLMRDFSPLADFQAAGAVGYGGGESGGFTQIQEKNPTVPGSKGGYGFFQWRGMGSELGRRRVFENLLKAMRLGPDSYDANYEMLKGELKTSEKATITQAPYRQEPRRSQSVLHDCFRATGQPALRRADRMVQDGACRLRGGREEGSANRCQVGHHASARISSIPR